MTTRCRNCNAEVTGLVCNECGTYIAINRDKESELTMLEEYHRTLQNVTDVAMVIPILENGFLPQHPETLIEAGFRCLPLIQSDDSKKSTAARRRLETIISKLKITNTPKLTSQPMAEFEAKLKEAAAQDRANNYFYTGCFFLFFIITSGLCGSGVYWFWG